VLFDTLFSQMQNNEIIAILGHELGHWKRWHTIQGFVITQAYLLVAFMVFAKMQYNEDLYRAFGFAPEASDLNSFPVLIGLVLFFQTIWCVGRLGFHVCWCARC
jgi:STE24 endopeptidase